MVGGGWVVVMTVVVVGKTSVEMVVVVAVAVEIAAESHSDGALVDAASRCASLSSYIWIGQDNTLFTFS